MINFYEVASTKSDNFSIFFTKAKRALSAQDQDEETRRLQLQGCQVQVGLPSGGQGDLQARPGGGGQQGRERCVSPTHFPKKVFYFIFFSYVHADNTTVVELSVKIYFSDEFEEEVGAENLQAVVRMSDTSFISASIFLKDFFFGKKSIVRDTPCCTTKLLHNFT